MRVWKTTAATAVLLVALCGPLAACATTGGEAAAVEEAEAPAERLEGLIPLRLNREDNAVLMELPAPGPDGVMLRVIHHTSLRTGVGSAVTGLDRASWRNTRTPPIARPMARWRNRRRRATPSSARPSGPETSRTRSTAAGR